MSTSDRKIQTLVLCTAVGVSAFLAGILFQRSTKRDVDKTLMPPNDAPTSPQVSNNGLGSPHPSVQHLPYRGCIYLDYNATSPVFPEVTQKILPFITNCHGNPSSTHVYARPCSQAIQEARLFIGRLINAPSPLETIYMSSCGSEADNRAIDIALHHFRSKPENANIVPKIVTCKTEHPAVICYLRILQINKQILMQAVPVDSEGFVDMDIFAASLTKETALVTIMHSNNEVGTIQPIGAISQVIQRFNQANGADILLHSDAAQSLGKVAVDVQALSVDMLTIVGHKFGAPKGIGALYVNNRVQMCPMLIGGGQERGYRAGTENVAFIAALGEACRLAVEEADDTLVHMLTLKHALLTKLNHKFGGEEGFIRFNGPVRGNSPNEIADLLKMMKAILSSRSRKAPKLVTDENGVELPAPSLLSSSGGNLVEQLPNTVSVAFRGIKAYELISLLNDKVACSAGSACHAHDAAVKMSDVLVAMGVTEEYGFGTLRLSFGRHTTLAEIDAAVEHIHHAVTAMKEKRI